MAAASEMFEISADDIALLNDGDLRSLVGLLCESEARRRGLPTSCVTWGGNQTAADGGLDVRVAFAPGITVGGFVPRTATGFQVKRPDMPRSAILTEMRPSGVLRPVIRELANDSGAYVIVSSTGSTSDTALKNRREAMAEAVNDLANRSSLALDFYDRTRLATWVRDHPSLILWVRAKVGKALSGWSSYGAWAYAPEGSSGEYLLDEKLSIRTPKSDSAVPPLEGIKQIRDLLRSPGNVVRLIGLSGVGKTRLAQALFDDRIGENHLDPSLGIYTNLAAKPEPQPMGLASDLIADRTRAIVVVDNCPSELHRHISELCRSPGSMVSVITIEYDIREDQPEGTEVFQLERASTELIEKLVQHRFPAISTVDSHTIAECAGGNARIAIALANTIRINETISGLPDEDLFQRLFQQRHGKDESLLLVAQACSLVYSFEGEDISNDGQAELVRLGRMIEKSAQEVFRNVAELRRRDLVQQRGVWRAILPHAIANRLAARALQNIPFQIIEAQLISGAPERLLKSFSRRLGYLHDSENAIAIVESWLAPGGRLGALANLNDIGKAVLYNVAPVAPEAVLAALELALLGPDANKTLAGWPDGVHLIRSLAFDAKLFQRCAALLLKYAKRARDDGESSDAPAVFSSLFFLHLSGTHATIEQRLGVIEPLLLSGDSNECSLGLKSLEAALETSHFISVYHFEFGARSRDHGYRPRSERDVKHWYGSVLSLAERLACADRPVAPLVCAVVAAQFRGLWTVARMFDELEHVCLAISGKQFWPEGWIAVRETLKFDSEKFAPGIVARLASLERRLRPVDLVQKVRAIVLSPTLAGLALDDVERESADDLEAKMKRTEAFARSLGKAVAIDAGAFDELVGELITGRGHLTSFGQGLLEGTPDPKATWYRLVTQLATKAEDEQNVQILVGFLSALYVGNPHLADRLLEAVLQNGTLAAWYPCLQNAVPIDAKGVDRIKRSLTLVKTAIARYSVLSTHEISGRDLREVVLAIAAKPGGLDPALEILSMRLYFDDREKRGHAAEVVDAGRQLLRQLRFTKQTQREDYRLAMISKSCFVGEEGAAISREICRALKESVSKRETHSFHIGGFLQAMLTTQPVAVLDVLCSGDTQEIGQGVRIIQDLQRHGKSLLDAVAERDLLDWCDREPTIRYVIAAGGVTVSLAAEQTGSRRWTDIALTLLEKAPDRVALLKEFVRRFRPMSWNGSRAAIMASNAKLLDQLEGYADQTVTEFVAQEKDRLSKEIEAERRMETLADRSHNERFE